MQVDPANRLVADSLEADWNGRLRALAEAQEEYQRLAQRRSCHRRPGAPRAHPRARGRLPHRLAGPEHPQRERKRMLALLVEDVTLLKQRQVTAHVRFRGGRASRRDPQQAGLADRRRGSLRGGERAVGPILGGTHESQGTTDRCRHAHRPADRRSARRPSDHHREVASRGTPRGADLQRDGPVAVHSPATTPPDRPPSERAALGATDNSLAGGAV